MIRKGFTLIELLVVIAIIAILSAIIFPVFARAKDSANRSADISNMNTLRTALQLYRIDQGGYPPALLGFVSRYAGNSDVIPANNITGYLYPKRVESIRTFVPAYNRAAYVTITNASWPKKDDRPIGTAAILDLNGDGRVDANDDLPNARQKNGYTYGPEEWVCKDRSITNCQPADREEFYVVDGYDISRTPRDLEGAPYELRYAKFWTIYGLGGGHVNDDPRQLGYSEPPDTTPVTWNTYFRDYADGRPNPGRRDIVLFLGGAAKPYDSRALDYHSWRVMP